MRGNSDDRAFDRVRNIKIIRPAIVFRLPRHQIIAYTSGIFLVILLLGYSFRYFFETNVKVKPATTPAGHQKDAELFSPSSEKTPNGTVQGTVQREPYFNFKEVSHDADVAKAVATLRRELQALEKARAKEFWRKHLDEIGVECVSIAISSPTLEEIEIISKSMAKQLDSVVRSKREECRKRLQRLYDEYTDFPQSYILVHVRLSDNSPIIRLVATRANNLDAAQPDAKTGAVKSSGSIEMEVERMDTPIEASNTRFGYLIERGQ